MHIVVQWLAAELVRSETRLLRSRASSGLLVSRSTACRFQFLWDRLLVKVMERGAHSMRLGFKALKYRQKQILSPSERHAGVTRSDVGSLQAHIIDRLYKNSVCVPKAGSVHVQVSDVCLGLSDESALTRCVRHLSGKSPRVEVGMVVHGKTHFFEVPRPRWCRWPQEDHGLAQEKRPPV